MTGARKIIANRANAQASTGPKTARGKARAAQNAHAHGLSLSIASDATYSMQTAKLANVIASTSARREAIDIACRIAEAQLDLVRIRAVKHDLIRRFLVAGGRSDAIAQSESIKKIARIDRYERRALSQRKFAIRALDQVAAVTRALYQEINPKAY